jgi:hypothetical protein
MIKKTSLWILSKVAHKSHDVRIQLLVSTLYGSITLYGIGGTVALVMKARKLSTVPTRKVVKRG